MANSMTGFGRCEGSYEKRRICVEIKSVNHRYLDINIRLPRQLNALEARIRNEVKRYVSRGKIDVFVTYEDLGDDAVNVTYNEGLAKEYMNIAARLAETFQISNDLSVSRLMRCPDVMVVEEKNADEEERWKQLVEVVDGACQRLSQTRASEGKLLVDNLLRKLAEITQDTVFITKRAPQLIVEYKARLKDKVRELLEDASIDESRIAAETTIFADKICVDEELVRMASHIMAMKDTLTNPQGDIGRKLDFLAQEMNREANTILSKTTDVEISNKAISLKTEIEKIREQVQNIE